MYRVRRKEKEPGPDKCFRIRTQAAQALPGKRLRSKGITIAAQGKHSTFLSFFTHVFTLDAFTVEQAGNAFVRVAE